MIKELIIIGAGPAGITAGVYAARKKMDFLIITKDVGGQALLSWDIENYPGYQFITGIELVEKFKKHIEEFDVELKEKEEVKKVIYKDGIFEIKTENSEYFTKSVIIATGRRPKSLNVKGEEEFKNKGITYCSTCDGPLFAGKNVMIIGGGNSGVDSALQMVKICPKVYIVEIKNKLSADKIAVEKLNKFKNVEILTNTKIKEIYGDRFVKGVIIETQEEEKNIEVEGIFIEIGTIPNSEIIDFVKKNEKGEIIVDCKTRTSFDGIFAAGDVTNVFAKQIVVACGEGAKAAMASFEYINRI